MSTAEQKEQIAHRQAILLDLLMLILVVLDLSWIAFDQIFDIKLIREQLFDTFLPQFSRWYYEEVHQSFLLYESTIFGTFFIVEISLRWLWAIWKKRYAKWFFYPIVHWYDVLGCIPLSSFRVLRFLRVIALLYSLHKWKFINLYNYSLFRLVIHYYNIAVEEISDRVAISLLEEAKIEIRRGTPLSKALAQDVFRPRHTELTDWAAGHIQAGLQLHYHRHRYEIQAYLKDIIEEITHGNKEVKRLQKIPVLGKSIQQDVEQAVSSITFGVIDRLTTDLANKEHLVVLETTVAAVLEVIFQMSEHSKGEKDNLANDLVIESVDLIINRIRKKRWQEVEASWKA